MNNSIKISTIDEFYRKRTIELHKFFFEQSKEKILSNFENIEEDAEAFQTKWIAQNDSCYSPEQDPAAFFEKTQEEAVEFYLKLKELRNNTYLSSLSALYFDWDKTVRNTLIQILKDEGLLPLETQSFILSKGFVDIMNLFIGLGWDIKSENCYVILKKYSTVVNVYRHGYGRSFKRLKQEYPEFIRRDFEECDIDFAMCTELILSDANLQEFSDAVISFWSKMPEFFLIKEENEKNLPDWF